MAKRLMNLRNVPDDEAAEVRELLEDHGIDYYETPPGAWGISAAAIWLRDTDQYGRARDLLKTYQAERHSRMRAEYEERKRAGEVEGFLAYAMSNPVKVAFYLGLSLAILIIFATPVYQLATG